MNRQFQEEKKSKEKLIDEKNEEIEQLSRRRERMLRDSQEIANKKGTKMRISTDFNEFIMRKAKITKS